MSYARFSSSSDVYVFPERRGRDGAIVFTCCWCALRGDGHDAHMRDRDGLVAHLAKHRRAGHRVPMSIYARLRAERGLAAKNEHVVLDETGAYVVIPACRSR